MTEDKFNALVERLSVRARTQPLRYRFEVLALAALGYGYILVLLIGALLTSVLVIAVSLLKPILLLKLLKVVWLPIWFARSVLRALWVKFDPPKGRELFAHEAPRLFAEIDSIRAAIQGPRPHHVLITDDYNAAVTQRPRLGPLGWPRSYLILGLPLMSALSPDQLRAVIAHEFGHLGAGDSRMSGRIYHMRLTWARLQQQFAERGGVFFRRFFAWFGPYFNAYSFVLARTQEYAADAAAARLVGAGASGEALVLAELGGEFQSQHVWQPLWERVKHDEQPLASPYSQLLQKSRSYADWSDAETRLYRSLQRKTTWTDTHPALSDRLAAIGETAKVPSAQGPSAAEVLLGETAVKLARELDELWRSEFSEQWRERYQQTQAQRQQLGELETLAAQSPLDRDQAWKQATLVEALHDGATALPLFEAHRLQHTDSLAATFAVGRILLERGDAAGLPMIDAAMKSDAAAIKPGAELAHRYLMGQGRREDAEPYRLAWIQRHELEQRAADERARFGPKHNYEHHGLDAEAVERLRRRCGSLAFVSRIWLVRKTLTYCPERPAYLMLVKPRWHKRIKPARAEAEVRAALELPDDLAIVIHGSDYKALFKRATKLKDCEIYRT